AEPVPSGSRAMDLYAGVGLFSMAAALLRSARVTAVEGDRYSAADLAANTAASGATVEPVHAPVEAFVGRIGTLPAPPDTVVVDPPRTGVSREALDGIIALGAARLIYVSCDVATLARDARRPVDAEYSITKIHAV